MMVAEQRLQISFQIVSPLFSEKFMPRYSSSGAAGMDLHACIEQQLTVLPGARAKVPTGIAIQLPNQGVVALVYARSGLAWKQGLALANGVGVIDSDYTGEVQVILVNSGEAAVTIEPGDRIAQLVMAPIYIADWVQRESLSDTQRGSGGFGSTGVHELK